MRATRKNWLAAVIVTAGVALSAVSCSDGFDTVRTLTPEIRRVSGPLPAGIIYEVGAGPTSESPDGGGRNYGSTGATILPGTVARVRASGDVTLSRNGGCDPKQPPTYSSPITPHGLADGSGRVLVDVAGGIAQDWQADGAGYVMHMAREPGDTAIGIIAGRKGIVAYCSVPDNAPAIYEFNISGSTVLTIDILGISVAASAQTVQAGQSIHFTPATINFSRTGQITYFLDTLEYQPTIAITSCTNLLECDYVPPQSGRVRVCMYNEQGHPICGESEQINVIKCPTGDTILDNPVFRNALRQALKDSRADSLPTSVRREVGGYALFDSTGLRVIRTETISTPCSVDYSAPTNAVLIFHTHPFNPPEGLSGPERIPLNCPSKYAGLPYDANTWGGPSPADWESSIQVGKPAYVIDRKRIYVTNPLVTDSTQWRTSVRRYDWNTRRCKW